MTFDELQRRATVLSHWRGREGLAWYIVDYYFELAVIDYWSERGLQRSERLHPNPIRDEIIQWCLDTLGYIPEATRETILYRESHHAAMFRLRWHETPDVCR